MTAGTLTYSTVLSSKLSLYNMFFGMRVRLAAHCQLKASVGDVFLNAYENSV